MQIFRLEWCVIQVVLAYATVLLHLLIKWKKGKKKARGCWDVWSSFSPPHSLVESSFSADEGDNNHGKKRNAPLPGCLDAITLDLMWITTYILGLCLIAIFANVLIIFSIGIFLRKLDWKNEWGNPKINKNYPFPSSYTRKNILAVTQREREREERKRKEEESRKEGRIDEGTQQLCFASESKVKVGLPFGISSPEFEINLTVEYK